MWQSVTGRNIRRHINTVLTEGPGLYGFPSHVHLQVKIHLQLTNTRLNVLLLQKILRYQNRSARIWCAIVSIVTVRQTGSAASKLNICLAKTNIKVVLIPWNKYIWMIHKIVFPTSQKKNTIRLHCRQQLVKYIQKNKTGKTVFHIVVHTVPNTKNVGNKKLYS